jgi:CBS domain-containing protein
MTHASTTAQPALTDVEVGTAMHHGVVTAPATAAPRRVAAIMAAHDVHAVVVTDVGSPRVRTDLDVIAAVLDEEVTVHRSESGLPELDPGAPLSAAAEEMVRRETSHVLVSGPRGALPIGVVSSFDVAAVVAGRDPAIARMARPSAARPALSEGRLDHLTVADVMHAGIIGVAPDTPLRDVAGVLADRRVHAVSVAGIEPGDGGGKLVWAIATDLDVVRAVAAGAQDATARSIAGTEPLVVDADTPLDDAARLLVDHGVSHAIVADGQAATGILSSLDVLRVLAIAA